MCVCVGLTPRPSRPDLTSRPHVPALASRQHAESDLGECDLLIILGTSLKVQPFASLVGLVREDVPRLLINREQVFARRAATPRTQPQTPRCLAPQLVSLIHDAASSRQPQSCCPCSEPQP